MINIEVTDIPLKKDLHAISAGIQAFNQKHLPDAVVFEADTKFAVFAKDAQGKVLGGIRATAFWDYCIIELLWLAESVRGLGIGTQLMQAAEAFALEKGFTYLRTETLSFQAKPFYLHLGFREFGKLEDYPKGHTTYCLVKKITNKAI